MTRFVVCLPILALLAPLAGPAGAGELPPDVSSDYARVAVVGKNGKVRHVTMPKACLTEDPTAMEGFDHWMMPVEVQPNLPPGCANALNLQRMIERESDLYRGRRMGEAPAAPSVRAAQRYLYGTEAPLGGGTVPEGDLAPPNSVPPVNGRR